VYIPAPSYGSVKPRNGVGIVTFSLGLIVMAGLVGYAAWLAVTGLATDGSAAQPAMPGAVQATARPAAATPGGTTMAFDQLWTASDGNSIVVGPPTVGTATHTGEPVIQILVTLTNNSEQDWNLESTTFAGKLNRTPVPESTEGDWMYSAPIVPHTSVTLTKVFITGPGQFTVAISTPHDVALFSGRV
jgi:hypothetical protein